MAPRSPKSKKRKATGSNNTNGHKHVISPTLPISPLRIDGVARAVTQFPLTPMNIIARGATPNNMFSPVVVKKSRTRRK